MDGGSGAPGMWGLLASGKGISDYSLIALIQAYL